MLLMKKILLLLTAAIAMAMLVPAANAYDKDPWHSVDKILHDLYPRMDAVDAKRQRYGAGPHLRDEIARLHFGISNMTAQVRHEAGDPEQARKDTENLSFLMTQVEAEYRDRIRHGVIIKVYPG